jgi:hypothetical protein
MSSAEAGYIGARPEDSSLTDFSCNAPPVHTFGSAREGFLPITPGPEYLNELP